MEEKTFKFDFTLEELDTILKALQELPFRKVNVIVNKVIKGYEDQTKIVEDVSTTSKK